MWRRSFLRLTAGAGLAVVARPAISAPSEPTDIGAIAFDLFTIFDPGGIDRRVAALVGDVPALATTWKARLFEYCWIRALSGRYVDFERLVHDSLVYAAKAHGVEIAGKNQAELEAAFTELELWPDAREALGDIKERGFRLATLANFAPRMIERLLDRAGVRELFTAAISTDQARTYKPDPRAYALAETTFALPRRRIAFAAFGGWDAAGARWYGYPTFWVNRLDVAPEELIAADASGTDLLQLGAWAARG
jgi:2-haloacid dehalogenase